MTTACEQALPKRKQALQASGGKTLANLVQPDGWARREREGYGEPCDVTSLSLTDAIRRNE